MSFISSSKHRQVAVLQSLEAQVAALGTDVAKLAASQQQRSGRIGGWLPSCSLPETLSTRQALLLAAMAATASASAALAWTTRRQRQS